jgi:chemotaxis protein MotA
VKFFIGLTIVTASVIGGFAGFGGHVPVLWQPYEIAIIVGSAFGIFILSNPTHVIKETGTSIVKAIGGKTHDREDYLDLLSLLFTLFREGKAKGVMSLEHDIENPTESAIFNAHPRAMKHERSIKFLCDYLRLISLGSENSKQLGDLMNEEISTLSKEMSRPLRALNAIGEALPAFGIIAAVLGIIKAMGYINQSTDVLGHMIGGALVGTFLGVLLAYALVMPLAALMSARRDEAIAYYVCIRAGLVAYLNGFPPQIAIEYSRKVLFGEVQPDFEAVEQATSAASRAARAQAAA